MYWEYFPDEPKISITDDFLKSNDANACIWNNDSVFLKSHRKNFGLHMGTYKLFQMVKGIS